MSRDRRCLFCEYDDPAGLVDTPLCRDHLAQLRGRSVMEEHHILGRENSDDVVAVTANLHAYVTPILRDCEKMSKKLSTGSPLCSIALAICSIGAAAEWFAKHYRRFADWLVALDGSLTEKKGERWWERTDLGPLYRDQEDIHDELHRRVSNASEQSG